jgi:hypothetical protein
MTFTPFAVPHFVSTLNVPFLAKTLIFLLVGLVIWCSQFPLVVVSKSITHCIPQKQNNKMFKSSFGNTVFLMASRSPQPPENWRYADHLAIPANRRRSSNDFPM